VDYEYERQGCCNLFLIFQPLTGWREVHVTERRTKEDFARQMKWLVDEVFPEAEGIRVVLDNLNTHTPAVLYQTFPPEEARRLTRKLAFHYTPKHGSWLNMTEIEFSILARQCLDRRLPDIESVRREVDAWAKARSEVRATVQCGSPRPMPGSRFVAFIISNQCGQVLVPWIMHTSAARGETQRDPGAPLALQQDLCLRNRGIALLRRYKRKAIPGAQRRRASGLALAAPVPRGGALPPFPARLPTLLHLYGREAMTDKRDGAVSSARCISVPARYHSNGILYRK
jgi:hypothetical protein